MNRLFIGVALISVFLLTNVLLFGEANRRSHETRISGCSWGVSDSSTGANAYTKIKCHKGPQAGKFYTFSVMKDRSYFHNGINFPDLKSGGNVLCGCASFRPSGV